MGLKLRMFLALALFFSILYGFGVLVSMLLGVTGKYLLTFSMCFAVFLSVIQWAVSAPLMDAMSRVTWISRDMHPKLWDMVHELAKKAGVKVKKVGIDPSPIPNAYTYGRWKSDSRIVVTRGLLSTCTEDEIEAVIGHEIGHIVHRDMVVMTMLGGIVAALYWTGRSLLWADIGDSDREEGSIFLIALLATIVYFIGQLIILLISRIREYHADEFSAKLTRKPHCLASALARITYGAGLFKAKDRAAEKFRSFYIIDPVQAVHEARYLADMLNKWDLDRDGVLSEYELRKAMEHELKTYGIIEIFQTHPLTAKRIMRLAEIARELKIPWMLPRFK